MAMEDAVVLGRCLSGSSQGEVEKALRGFEQARKDRTSQVQLHSHQNQWMKQTTDPLWVYGYDAWSTPLS